MAEDKKTQLGTVGRTNRPTGSQQPAAAAPTPAPVMPAATPAPGHPTSYLPEQPDPLLGQTVADRYLIARKLGEGGMGTVYLATHKILEKQVALKVLHGEFARKPDLVERFIQEAKAASRIRHENVIDISDFGSTPDGLVFFAMELLQGHDLHDEVTRAKMSGHLLPWSRSKKIFLQICAALSAAHAKGIIHRDLKPENVYLVDFLGDPDFVKLLDFGIAKVAEADGEGGRKLTKTGMLFGTPEYMSPEQARGEQVDHRVDVYAMGCILFQLVTGRVPFEAENFMGVLSMHLTEQPPMVSSEVLDSIGAPRALADVIDRALCKDRNARWQTIDELAAAVREVSGDPAPADRSQPMRAASVPAPATTTRAKPPTGPVDVPRRRPATVDQSSRVKTQWTGSLKVPEVAAHEPPPPSRSKLPLIVGVAVVIIGGAIAAVVATGHGGSSGGNTVASGAGSAAVALGSATPGSAAVQPPPPPPPPEPKLPDMVMLTLDSTPHGATVTDLATGKALGRTPLKVTTPGSKTPKQYQFHLHGYGDTTVELPLTREAFAYTEVLEKGATSGTPIVHKVVDDTLKTVPDLGSAVTHPDTGSAAKLPDVTRPDTGSAVKPPDVPHPDTGSAAKPPDVPRPDTGSAAKPPDHKDPDCADDELPCLKGFGSGH